MSILGLFFKKTENRSEEKNRLKGMKLRKITYVDCDFARFVADMEKDPKTILSLSPVNYYAVKNQYIMAHVYSSDDLEENYVSFSRYDYEHKTDESRLFELDRELLSKTLAKVGIIV